mmetsp:Transcript_7125/g.14232  ORF Transcript_7125/g.14232 Transcript_7125/m.14232 type:complete len:360 (+) Transcript_7125:2074-3153(+)
MEIFASILRFKWAPFYLLAASFLMLYPLAQKYIYRERDVFCGSMTRYLCTQKFSRELQSTGENMMDFRWTRTSPKTVVLPADWVSSANNISTRNYNITCKQNCGLLGEAKAAFLPFNYSLSMITHKGTREIVPFPMPKACDCLRKFKTILAFGDSHMRRIMVSWMENNDNIMINAKETASKGMTLEKAALLPCAHIEQRPDIYKLSAWRFEHLEQFVVPTLNSLQANNTRVDLLIVGFGLHNVEYSSIPEHIEHVYATLSAHPALHQAQFLWTLSHMVAMKGDDAYVQKVADRNILIRRYNDFVLDFFSSKRDPKWTVIDFFHLTRDRLVLAQDAAHFQTSLYRWKNHIMLNLLCPLSS